MENDKNADPHSSSKRAARLRVIGIIVLLLGLGSAGVVYWLGTRSPDVMDDLSMVGYNKAQMRQMGMLYGKMGPVIEEWFDDLKQPGTQADGFYLLERGSADFLPGIKADTFFIGSLKNSGDSFRLFDKNCGLIDEIISSSSWPAGDNTNKKTMERDSKTLKWHTSKLAGGTPKEENDQVSIINGQGNTNNDKAQNPNDGSTSSPFRAESRNKSMSIRRRRTKNQTCVL